VCGKQQPSLERSLDSLAGLEAAHLTIGAAMLQAYDGTYYPLDMLVTAVLNRSYAHISGFRQLLGEKNLLCAGAIMRLQLDTAMRFYAAHLVSDPHEFALDVLDGKRVRDIRDASDNQMNDGYLKDKLGELYEWVPRVYDRTSGYVHLSAVHMLSALSAKPNSDPSSVGTLVGKISAVDHDLPEFIYIEAVDAFCAATGIILDFTDGWVFTKANPELVAKWRRERESADA
jgi:hypothetical protein